MKILLKKLIIFGAILFILALVSILIIIDNVNEKLYSEKEVKIATEVTQALEQMSADGLLYKQYIDTDAFVDVLQNYLKINKRCDANHIEECWPSRTITANDGVRHNVSDITTRDQMHLTHFNMGKNMNVGLVLSSGASIIFTYDYRIDSLVYDNRDYSIKTLPIGWGKTWDFSYTTPATEFVDFIMDVNGAKGPNRETNYKKAGDIRSFKRARIGSDCPDYIVRKGKKIKGMCLVNLGKDYSPLDCSKKNKDFVTKIYCGGAKSSSFKEDYWAGAKKACKDIGLEIPMITNLQEIAVLNKNRPADLPNSGWFWSLTASSSVPKTVGRITDFSNGIIRYHQKDAQFNVLCSGI